MGSPVCSRSLKTWHAHEGSSFLQRAMVYLGFKSMFSQITGINLAASSMEEGTESGHLQASLDCMCRTAAAWPCTELSLWDGGLWPYISWYTYHDLKNLTFLNPLNHFIFMAPVYAQASVKWIPPSWADNIIVPLLQPRQLALAAISKDLSRLVKLDKSPNQPAPLALGHAGTFFLTQHRDHIIQYNLCYYQACVSLRGKYYKNGLQRSDIQIVPVCSYRYIL